jgi:anti-sigma B factor antagonist
MDENLNFEKMQEGIDKFNTKLNETKELLKSLKKSGNLTMSPFEIIKNENYLVIRVNIPRATMKDLENYTNALGDFDSYGVKNVIYDLSKVEHIDSTFLGQIILLLKKIMQMEGKVHIVSQNESVKSLFVLTRLLRALPIFSSLDDAIANL